MTRRRSFLELQGEERILKDAHLLLSGAVRGVALTGTPGRLRLFASCRFERR